MVSLEQSTDSSHRRARQRVRFGHLVVLALAVALAGCETSPATQTGRLDVRAAIANGQLQSPKGAAMAFASIEGAPETVTTRLKQDLASEAATRQITVTDPAVARYLVRGYLDAYATDAGTSVHYVWDIFDAAKQRMQRVDDAFDLPSSGGTDPWGGVNDAVLAGIAAKSTDDLALLLGKTPEAAGADKTAAVATAGQTAN